jgi:hypothetical protein
MGHATLVPAITSTKEAPMRASSASRLGRRFTLAVLGVCVALGAGCRTAPIYNVSNAPLTPPPGATLSLDQVGKAIRTAGERLRWEMVDTGPGAMTGTLVVNKRHVAVVSITYDTSRFSIAYKESKLLLQEDNVIHRHYNDWVMRLETAIQQEVARPS